MGQVLTHVNNAVVEQDRTFDCSATPDVQEDLKAGRLKDLLEVSRRRACQYAEGAQLDR